MKSKILPSVLLVAVLGIAAYWYGSPFLALHNIKTAVKEGDAESLNKHIDYPLLRENLKVQFSSMIQNSMPKGMGIAEGLGATLGQAMVSQLVDATIQPNNVLAAMKEGQFGNKRTAVSVGEPDKVVAASTPTNDAEPKVVWSTVRMDANKLMLIARDAKTPMGPQKLGLVFERYGFANWKLTDLLQPGLLK